jgi:ribonuclease D
VAARDMPENELPTRAPRGDGPPVPRAWAEKDPVAARRLTLAREAFTRLSEELAIPVENLLTPDYLRRTLWSPPRSRDEEALADGVRTLLAGYGARPWQIDLTTPPLVSAILEADREPPPPEVPVGETPAEAPAD